MEPAELLMIAFLGFCAGFGLACNETGKLQRNPLRQECRTAVKEFLEEMGL